MSKVDLDAILESIDQGKSTIYEVHVKNLCLELKAAREVVKQVAWAGEPDSESYHGEDCNYWDHDTMKPTGDPCECDFLDMRNAVIKYNEATNV